MTNEEKEKDFTLKVHQKISFSYEMRQDFISYWTEPSSRGKMRFEFEKTWDLNRRLARWANSQKIGQKNGVTVSPKIAPVTSTIKEIRELDNLLAVYRLHPTEVPFAELGKFYDYLKENKLLRPMYPKEIEEIKSCYPDDNFKCRCACVELTLKWYTDTNFTFSNTMEARLKLTT